MLMYIDELIQISLNDDPEDVAEQDVESHYFALHNTQFNVMALVDASGTLAERYEYTPYGQRTVYTSAGSNDPLAMAPTSMSQRVKLPGGGGVAQPYGLNPIGHQGLYHDEETSSGSGTAGGLIYNRARMLHTRMARFMQRDPLGYVDGMSVYGYYAGMHGSRDYLGLARDRLDIVTSTTGWKWVGGTKYCAKKDGASLEDLAEFLIEDSQSWRCIWPNSSTDEDKSKRYYTRKQVAINDVVDAKNLIETDGISSRMLFLANEHEIRQVKALTGWELSFSKRKDLAEHIRDEAGSGKTPISTLSIFSHSSSLSHRVGIIWPGALRQTANPTFLNEASKFRDASGNYDLAKEQKGPPRCWFTPGAQANFFGCQSTTFAKKFADAWLRYGVAYGTTDKLAVTNEGDAYIPSAPNKPLDLNGLVNSVNFWDAHTTLPDIAKEPSRRY